MGQRHPHARQIEFVQYTDEGDIDQFVRSGDLLFFKGSDWSATLIEWLTWCVWSHVGIVIQGADLLNRMPRETADKFIANGKILPERFYLYESSGKNDTCVLTNRYISGAILVDLSAKIASYASPDGSVSVGLIKLRSQEGAKSEYIQRLADFIFLTSGCAYSNNPFSSTASLVPGEPFSAFPNIHSHLSYHQMSYTYNCAQLVIAALEYMYVLHTTTDKKCISPCLLWSGYGVLFSHFVNLARVWLDQRHYRLYLNVNRTTKPMKASIGNVLPV
jgi:hypothetical protein